MAAISVAGAQQTQHSGAARTWQRHPENLYRFLVLNGFMKQQRSVDSEHEGRLPDLSPARVAKHHIRSTVVIEWRAARAAGRNNLRADQ